MACGGWQNELREIVGVLTDAVSLESCSFLKAAEMEQADSKMLEEDERLAEILHKFIVSLLAFRILYASILQYGMPWAAAQLLTTGDTLKEHLKTWRQFYQDFVQLEKDCKLNPRAHDFRLRLVWPLWSWTKWLLCRLAEFGFEKVPDDMLDKL